MPRTRKDEATLVLDEAEITSRHAELDSYTVVFEAYHADVDPAELFRGLPDDRCQCPHWGYVVSGRLVIRFADREETYDAGDAYYAPAGHTPVVTTGTEVIEFSPTAALNETMAVLGANMQAHVHA